MATHIKTSATCLPYILDCCHQESHQAVFALLTTRIQLLTVWAPALLFRMSHHQMFFYPFVSRTLGGW